MNEFVGLCLFDVGGHRPSDEFVVLCLFDVGGHRLSDEFVVLCLFDVGGHRLSDEFVFDVGGDHVSFWSLIVVVVWEGSCNRIYRGFLFNTSSR